jgi:hypothetical protein
MDSRLHYFASGLFALALLAGCAAKDINSLIEGASRPARSAGQIETESRSEGSRSKNPSQTEPPNITYRPGG